MKSVLLSLIACSFIAPALADSWPQFRGPLGNGVASADNVPVHFGESKNLLWRTPLPGRGWSSPVVADGKVWLSTAIEVFPTDEERERLLTEAGEEPRKFKVRQVASSIRLAAVEVDFETGRVLREIELASIDAPQTIHTLNSFASPTPVLDEGRLYAHFGTFGTFCLNTSSGELEWKKRLPLEHSVGPGSSPFIHEDLLVLICDGVDQQYVTALDKETGEEVWRTDRPEMRAPLGDQKKAYNTPILIWPESGDPQLICMGSQWLVSYEPSSGREIWRLDHGSGFSVVPRPVFSRENGLVYISTGFGKPELLAVRVDGEGDITDSNKVVWRESKRIPAKPSFLLDGGELYVITDGGVATCFDSLSGEVIWTNRIEGNYSASPLLANGYVFFASHEGKVTIVRAGRDYEVVAENTLDEAGMLMASPLAFDGTLLIRGEHALYRFGSN